MEFAPSRTTASNPQYAFFAALQQSSKTNPTTGFNQSEKLPVVGDIDPLLKITFTINNKWLFDVSRFCAAHQRE
jgi:hypothetical protein